MTTTRPDRPEPIARFDAVWRGFAEAGTKDARVEQHAEDRGPLLDTLRAYARRARPARIVEIGCGSAIDLALLRREMDVLALGLDIAPAAVAAGRAFAEHLDVPLHFAIGDSFALPLGSGSVGLLFSQGLLEHFPDPRAALAEQARVVAPGGVVIVSVPQTFTGYTIHKRRAIRAGTWPWGWEDQYSASRLKRLGAEVGLVTESVFGYQYWRSWGEPAFVLRDLCGKVVRRLPGPAQRVARPASVVWDGAWTWLEGRLGQWFMQNVVAVFRVPGDAR